MSASDVHPAWFDTFHAFTWMHGLVVVCFCLSVHGAITFGRRHRGEPGERALRRVLCVLAWMAAIANVVWYALVIPFDWSKSLPLEVCDLAVFCGALALGPGWRWSRTLLFFWGLLLSSQGFITPTVEVGPAHARFWLFWSLHAAIVGASLYDLVVLGYRPMWRDLRFAWIASITYGAAVSAINVPTGFNYGKIGPAKEHAATIIDALGAWPLRIVWVAAIVLTMQGLAWAGFAWAGRRGFERS